MTNEEALKILKNISSAWENVAQALENVAQALEKQIPTDPLVYDNENPMMYALPWGDWGYECPCCGNRDIDYGCMFCECGQALKWGDGVDD